MRSIPWPQKNKGQMRGDGGTLRQQIRSYLQNQKLAAKHFGVSFSIKAGISTDALLFFAGSGREQRLIGVWPYKY